MGLTIIKVTLSLMIQELTRKQHLPRNVVGYEANEDYRYSPHS